MVDHTWGDGFDFDRLNQAANYLAEAYYSLTGKNIIWKEKYGTIRYEVTATWLVTREDYQAFLSSLILTASRFPNIFLELMDDAYFLGNWHNNDVIDDLDKKYGVTEPADIENKDLP